MTETPVVGVQMEAGVYFHTDQIVSALEQMAALYVGDARSSLLDALNYFKGDPYAIVEPSDPHPEVARVEIFPDPDGKWFARPVSADGSILIVTAGSFDKEFVVADVGTQWPGKEIHELQDAMGDSIWDEQDHLFGFNGRRRPSPRRLWNQ